LFLRYCRPAGIADCLVEEQKASNSHVPWAADEVVCELATSNRDASEITRRTSWLDNSLAKESNDRDHATFVVPEPSGCQNRFVDHISLLTCLLHFLLDGPELLHIIPAVANVSVANFTKKITGTLCDAFIGLYACLSSALFWHPPPSPK
jgi:hypothetical protein